MQHLSCSLIQSLAADVALIVVMQKLMLDSYCSDVGCCCGLIAGAVDSCGASTIDHKISVTSIQHAA